MIKRTIISFLLAMLFIPLLAQQFNAGLKAGMSATQISGDQLSGFDKPGIFAGSFVNLYVSENAAMQLEINFIQKGSKKNPKPDKNDFSEYLLNLNYIEVPLIYLVDFEEFSLEMGAAAAALISSKEEADLPLGETRDFDPLDVSLLVGGYFYFSDRMSANLRFEHSVLAVREHNSGVSYRLNKGQYNAVLVLALHYQISKI